MNFAELYRSNMVSFLETAAAAFKRIRPDETLQLVIKLQSDLKTIENKMLETAEKFPATEK